MVSHFLLGTNGRSGYEFATDAGKPVIVTTFTETLDRGFREVNACDEVDMSYTESRERYRNLLDNGYRKVSLDTFQRWQCRR